MRFISPSRLLVASILVAAAFGLPLINMVPASAPGPNASLLGLVISAFEVSSTKASVLTDAATINPHIMMANAPLDLPVEQYDSF